MIDFPGSKINIGLRIIRKRPDGYHELESLFYPLPLKDCLEIISNDNETITFSTSGIPIDGDSNNNLCVKAYLLLKKDFPGLPGINLHLHKAIPLGAGLGGGSSDAAYTLQLINRKYALDLSISQLQQYALELGSDCPFFILNKPCIVTGRGEQMEEFPTNLSRYNIITVYPGLHISTALAFSLIKPNPHSAIIKEQITRPIKDWRNSIINDFEGPVFALYPELASIKSSLYSAGALYASMSGSGSTIYGIFDKGNIPVLKFPPHYFYKWV